MGVGGREAFAAPVVGAAFGAAAFDPTFAGADFVEAGFAGAVFAGAVFAGAAFAGAAFAEETFVGAALAGAVLAGAVLAAAGFDAVVAGAAFVGAGFVGAGFVGAGFAAGVFPAVVFDPAPLTDALLEGVDFAEERDPAVPEGVPFAEALPVVPFVGDVFEAAGLAAAVPFAAGFAGAGVDARPFADPDAADKAAALFPAAAGDDVPFAGVGAGAFFAEEGALFRPGPFDPEAGEFDLLFAAMISCRR